MCSSGVGGRLQRHTLGGQDWRSGSGFALGPNGQASWWAAPRGPGLPGCACVGRYNAPGWGPRKVLPCCLCDVSLRFLSAGLIGFLFMLRALVAANFNTIYIYTAEVSFGEGLAYIKVFVDNASLASADFGWVSKNILLKWHQKVYLMWSFSCPMGSSESQSLRR